MKPHPSLVGLAAVAVLAVPARVSPAFAQKPLSAFGTELKPEGKARETSDPSGDGDLEDKPKRKAPDEATTVLRRAGRGARGGRVRIQLDGDEDGGGGGEFGSEAGSDPDVGDF
jgi:hypothetical protein